MSGSGSGTRSDRAELLAWVAGLGAVTAPALAIHDGCGPASARARLGAASRGGLLWRSSPLSEQPSLYGVTGAGLRACAEWDLPVVRVSAATAGHLAACALAAARLERRFPQCEVLGEPALRRLERRGLGLVSCAMQAGGRAGVPLRHRPDLALLDGGAAVAVEVELTVKSPERLWRICRAWARCRTVSGVLYLAAPRVLPALLSAVRRAEAGERIVALGLDALAPPAGGRDGAGERTIPGAA